MKRICRLSAACLLAFAPLSHAQNAPSNPAAAVASRQEAEENYNVLKGHVDDVLAAQADQDKQLQSIRKEIETLRQQVSKPAGNYASQDDLKQLADAVQELDKKREADKELILKEMEKLGHIVAEPIPSHTTRTPATTQANTTSQGPHSDQDGYYYVIKKGDTISLIAQAYREQGIKVSTTQITDANPSLNPAKLRVGQKIFIPAAKSSSGKGAAN